jgi:hypothetical protein
MLLDISFMLELQASAILQRWLQSSEDICQLYAK